MNIWNLFKSDFCDDDDDDDKYRPSDYDQKRENVYMFLRLPWALEKFMFYGFLQCTDSFLHFCSVLPLRFLFLLLSVFQNPFKIHVNIRKLFKPNRVVDICKILLVSVCYYMLTFIDTSMVYHIIRGQAIIKLYIFFNMLEVADRLLCSIGCDMLDALFWTITEPRNKKIYTIPHLILALVYVFTHAIVILCLTTTLNVAFNSHNKSLLTIMISNNFVEIKGSVFKKTDRNMLMQMSCSDVKERFQNLIILLIILIRNMSEFDWQLEPFLEMMPPFATIFFTEFFIDWIKHAFVLKFNNITSKVFDDYKLTLSHGYINSKKNKDHREFHSHRYGFMPIPLFCLLFRICTQSLRFSNETFYKNVSIGFAGIILNAISLRCIRKERQARAERKSETHTESTTKAETKSSTPLLTSPINTTNLTSSINKKPNQVASNKSTIQLSKPNANMNNDDDCYENLVVSSSNDNKLRKKLPRNGNTKRKTIISRSYYKCKRLIIFSNLSSPKVSANKSKQKLID